MPPPMCASRPTWNRTESDPGAKPTALPALGGLTKPGAANTLCWLQATKNSFHEDQHWVTVAKVETLGGMWRCAQSKGVSVVGGHQVKIWMFGVWMDVRTATTLLSKSHDWRTTWRSPPKACEPSALPTPDLPMFESPVVFRQETTPLAKLLLEL